VIGLPSSNLAIAGALTSGNQMVAFTSRKNNSALLRVKSFSLILNALIWSRNDLEIASGDGTSCVFGFIVVPWLLACVVL
jgi:hypothetical protein